MTKLDEQGLLIKEAWENIISDLPEGNICSQCRVAILIAERDALLELVEAWVDEADEVIKRNHYRDNGQEGIAYLYAQIAKLRTAKGKPPG